MKTIATLDGVKRRVKNINESTNDVQGSAYWNQTKRYITSFLHSEGIKEISVNDFHKLTGMNKELAFKMLKDINSDLFK